MDRRSLLKMIAATTGAVMFGSNVFAYHKLPAVALSDTQFKPEDLSLFNEVADIILPRTDTPGAKDANVGLMSLILVNDCYSEPAKAVFAKGLASLDDDCQQRFGKPFVLLTATQKADYIESLDAIAKRQDKQSQNYWLSVNPSHLNSDTPYRGPHFFTLIKQLTIFTFFTSEIGAKKVLRYDAIPGKYNGALDYKKGDRAWAT